MIKIRSLGFQGVGNVGDTCLSLDDESEEWHNFLQVIPSVDSVFTLNVLGMTGSAEIVSGYCWCHER